ncbi:MAG: hypothetical protein VW683_10110 [Betaproteobacteria bacterium]
MPITLRETPTYTAEEIIRGEEQEKQEEMFRTSPKAVPVPMREVRAAQMTGEEEVVSAIRRAETKRQAELKQAGIKAPFPMIPSEESLAERAKRIEETRQELGGETVLGFARTTYSGVKSIVDTLAGVANIPAVFMGGTKTTLAEEGRFTKEQPYYTKDRYVDYFKKEIGDKDRAGPFSVLYEAGDFVTAAAKTAAKIFRETPELKNEGEFFAELINEASRYGDIITPRETQELTNFRRPGAGAAEKIVRTIPEVALGTFASIKLMSRGKKADIRKATEELRTIHKNDAKKLKEIDEKGILAATQEDMNQIIGARLQDYGKGVVASSKFATPLTNIARRGKGERITYNLTAERNRLSREIQKRKGEPLLDRVSTRISQIQKPTKEIAVTEAGFALGVLTVGSVYSAEEEPPMLLTLGGGVFGGLTSGLGYQAVRGVVENGAKKFGEALFSNDILKIVDIEDFDKIASGLTKPESELTRNFVLWMKSLPKEDQERALSEIKYFGQIRDKLVNLGVDPEVLHTTIGKASGLVSVMHLQESLEQFAKAGAPLGAKTIDKTLSDVQELVTAKRFNSEYVTELRNLIANLSNKASPIMRDDARFSGFVKNLESSVIKIQDEMNAVSANFDQEVDKLLVALRGPNANEMLAVTKGKANLIEDTVEKLLKHKYITAYNKQTEAGAEGVRAAVSEVQERGSELLITTIRNESKKIDDLTGFQRFFNSSRMDINTDGAVDDFYEFGRGVRTRKLAKASAKFEILKGSTGEVDVTDWYVNLYTGGPYEKAIGRSAKDRVLQRLSKAGELKDRFAIEALGRISVDGNVMDFVKKNPSVLDEIRSALELDEEALPLRYYSEIFQAIKAINKDKDIRDVDVILSLRDIAEGIGIDSSSLKISITTDQLINTQSLFTSRSTKGGAEGKRYADLRDSLIQQMEVGDQAQLREAKRYYINNVIMPYRDKVNSPIGYSFDNFAPNGNHVIRPESLMIEEMSKFTTGTREDADKFIDHLAKTFGAYNEKQNTYVFGREGRRVVKNIMNNLLSYKLYQLDQTKAVREALKTGNAKLRSVRAQKAATGMKNLESDFLNRMKERGLLDLQEVVDYNYHVETVLKNSIEYKEGETALSKMVDLSEKKLRTAIKTRTDVLNTARRFLPEGTLASEQKSEAMFNSFVLNDGAIERTNDLIRRTAANTKKSEDEIRSGLSDIIIDSLSRQTYSHRLDDAVPGKYTYNFDYEKFFSLVQDNSAALKNIVGDQKFEALDAISQSLRISNRRSKDYLQASGVNLSAPGGLSIESLMSRLYSVSRGVVSPRYVLTEIALLRLRKQNVSALKNLLDDPKLVDEIVDLVQNDNIKVIERINARLTPIIVSTLAEGESYRKKQRMSEQIKALEVKEAQ